MITKGLVLTTVLALGLPAVASSPAHAAPPAGLCTNADPARPVISQLPWAQQTLDPAAVWPYSTGAGVLVAVIDSGVDVDHPQLRAGGKVRTGEDFFQVGRLRATFDCDSHGTAVASIIAAAPQPGTGFRGFAPEASVLPVRVSERATTDGSSNEIDPLVLAQGIRYAADQRAKVINLSMAGHRDEQVVRQAIAYAQNRDVLVVAAVGNAQDGNDRFLPSFPAAYPGVLGVGALNIGGNRVSGSQIGSYVDLMAPGEAVVGAARRGGHNYYSGTSFAVPFVTATAALVRAAWPQLSAPQVAERLMATATPARGGSAPPAYGAGMVDPYRAVTEGLASARPAKLPVLIHPPVDQRALDAAATSRQRVSQAWFQAGLAGVAALVIVVLAGVVPAGLRRRWRPARTGPLPADRSREEPPDQLFLLPPPSAER